MCPDIRVVLLGAGEVSREAQFLLAGDTETQGGRKSMPGILGGGGAARGL